MCFLWFLWLSWVGWRAVMYVTDLVMFVTRRASRALYWDRGYTVLRCHFEVRFGLLPEAWVASVCRFVCRATDLEKGRGMGVLALCRIFSRISSGKAFCGDERAPGPAPLGPSHSSGESRETK